MFVIGDSGFSVRLDYLICETGITGRELAKRTGTTPEIIYYWRYGIKRPAHLNKIISIAKEFNVKTSWLLFGFLK